ncbi:Por secretion system C-terminal sorting domain-containing protein [Flavobacterium fluvii]|uniref:Por secretion system C-terminal sorting domain-containing protein n=1 Tax=Flavobacterium fluvii TaxID=468056 RepID=A0A1M5KDM6_9FLAO|nr:T9SS type A sorting domain-containing protein [Flavobacterium fluvii]SHG50912.1 Por secretion system C-terminal sorting domain-containing protein [Flavobacterium fluvii]
MKKKLLPILVVVFTQLINTQYTYAQWSSNAAVNNAICTAFSNQERPQIISDGSGGAIITWQDYRSFNDYDIYAQRINAGGMVQWTANGVAICTATGNQQRPKIVSDGIGGAIITWQDSRSGFDVYAQRINASGVVQWTANGVAICTAVGSQYSLNIVSDGSAGAIITWGDYRNASHDDIYAQRINASGVVQWTVDGVAICTAAGLQADPTIASDGNGGAIITWQDYRSFNGYHIYAQRINASGTVQWTANGVAICTATGDQYFPTIVSDGSGGAIITWYTYGTISGNNNDIYAQHINASGVVQWTANGVAISTTTGSQDMPTIVSDGSAGAIITWTDNRSNINDEYDIYAQRINSSGTVQWTANGVAISTATDRQQWQTIVSDDNGGAIITWEDYRSGSTNTNIYAQRINASGVVQWTTNGVAVATATGSQGFVAIISDSSAGAIITWSDNRSSVPDIYAQRIISSGSLAISVFEKQDIVIYPNPATNILNINLSDKSEINKLTITDLSGKIIMEQNNSNHLDVRNLSKGIYVLEIFVGDVKETKKFIKD